MKASLTKTLLFLAVFTWAGGYLKSTPVSADPHNAKEQKTAVKDGGETHYPPVTLYEGMDLSDPRGIIYSDEKKEEKRRRLEKKFGRYVSLDEADYYPDEPSDDEPPSPVPTEDVIPITGDSSTAPPDEVM